MDITQIVTIVMAGGGGAALVTFVTGLFRWLSGAQGRERDKQTDLAAKKRLAEERSDASDVKRREAEEHVSILKRQLRENGLVPEERPDEEEN